MHKDNIMRKLKTHGVTEDDMITFKLKLRDKSFTTKECDNVLVKLGYKRLFSIEKIKIDTNNKLHESDLINEYIQRKSLNKIVIDDENSLI